MTKKLLALLLFVLTVTGCTQETITTDQADAYMNYDNRDPRRRVGLPQQWGQQQVFVASRFQEGQELVVLQNDGSDEVLPQVRTLLLSLVPKSTPNVGNYAMRWVVRTGVGGASSRIIIDALGTQQISLPSSRFTISLMSEQLFVAIAGTTFTQPTADYTANVYVADGTTETQRAQYTQVTSIPAGGLVSLNIPSGANAFRTSSGIGDVARLNTFVFSLLNGSAAASFLGDSLTAMSYGEDFIPIPGGTTSANLVNNAGVGFANPIIQWGLDL